MISKMILFFVISVVAIATAQEAAPRYPAGVNPALCPGYPICDNSLLHTGAPTPWNWNQWNVPAVHGSSNYEINGPGGDKYPAGVNPAACPNYPYCGTLSAPYAYAPVQGWTDRQYPANVAPAACPNYPYCH